MAVSSTTLKPGQNLPKRGRDKRTLILEAIREEAMLGVDKGSSKDDAEKAVFAFMARSAFNPTPDTAMLSSTCLTHLMRKGWSDLKATMPCYEFEMTENGTPAELARDILTAAGNGDVPPDVAQALMSAMASMLKIDEISTMKDEIEEIKRLMGENDG